MREPLIVLVGPTAVGKTALALPLAHALDAEIVNVDSRQIYRYMDIGTAKPSAAEQAEIRHHLLDILCPNEPTSAAQFVVSARPVLAEIQRRGKRVLLVAGSGLYVQALLHGLMPAPAAYTPLRRILHAYAERQGTLALHQRLQAVDPEAAALYHPNDRLRLTRALEVTYLTGEPFSRHCQRHQQQAPLYPYIGLALTRERADLAGRITARADAMLAAGWVAEVQALVRQGYDHTCGAMQSLGYREILTYLAGEVPWDETVRRIYATTWQLAKRQLTWFRKMPDLAWFNLSSLDESTAVCTLVQHWRARLADSPPS